MLHLASTILVRRKVLQNTRTLKSALYITGDKAQHMFVAVYPYVDAEKTFEMKDVLLKNLSQRCLNINIDKIEKRFQFFKTIEDKKIILQETMDELRDTLNKVTKEPNINVDEVNRLKLHKHVVGEELKSLKEYLHHLEENVMISILNLPNQLHELTPDNDEVIHEHLEKPTFHSESHITIALKNRYIKLVDNWGCYLRSDAASFELAISNYFIDCLINHKFIQFQNADFARSVVVEGCGDEVVNNNKLLTIYEPNIKNEVLQELNRLHLTGSGSLHAFMAYFTKHSVQKSYFPLKYFCYGRSYNGDLRKNDNLFNQNQESVLNVFSATVSEDAMLNFKGIVDFLVEIYDNLGYHYRLVYLEPSKLKKNESLRLSIQMFSNNLEEYIEVGYLSYYGDYISKRLLFTCIDNKQTLFPKIIAGDILNVQKILGCVLENNSVKNSNILSEMLKQHMP